MLGHFSRLAISILANEYIGGAVLSLIPEMRSEANIVFDRLLANVSSGSIINKF